MTQTKPTLLTVLVKIGSITSYSRGIILQPYKREHLSISATIILPVIARTGRTTPVGRRMKIRCIIFFFRKRKRTWEGELVDATSVNAGIISTTARKCVYILKITQHERTEIHL